MEPQQMVSNGIEAFLDYIREAEQLYRISVSNEQETNDATQDILHSLELEVHDYHSSARLALKLKEVRQARRVAKEKNTGNRIYTPKTTIVGGKGA